MFRALDTMVTESGEEDTDAGGNKGTVCWQGWSEGSGASGAMEAGAEAEAGLSRFAGSDRAWLPNIKISAGDGQWSRGPWVRPCQRSVPSQRHMRLRHCERRRSSKKRHRLCRIGTY